MSDLFLRSDFADIVEVIDLMEEFKDISSMERVYITTECFPSDYVGD